MGFALGFQCGSCWVPILVPVGFLLGSLWVPEVSDWVPIGLLMLSDGFPIGFLMVSYLGPDSAFGVFAGMCSPYLSFPLSFIP